MSDKIPIPRKLAAGLADPSASLSSSPDWARSSLGCSSERDDAFVRRDSGNYIVLGVYFTADRFVW